MKAVADTIGLDGDIRPDWSDNVPLCTESCPNHDGKRCMAIGHRPTRICEPAVVQLTRFALASVP